MAKYFLRLHRLGGSGYDVVHLETSSEVVVRPDGSSVEETLRNLPANVDSKIKAAIQEALGTIEAALSENVADAYRAVAEMGGTVPAEANSENLAEAIRSIPTFVGDTTTMDTLDLNSSDMVVEDLNEN